MSKRNGTLGGPICVLVALAAMLAGCGPTVSNLMRCHIEAPRMVAIYSDKACTQLAGWYEFHDGIPYASGAELKGKCVDCIAIQHGWYDKDEWLAARLRLGIPLDACGVSPAGDVLCPPKAGSVWGSVRRLYR